MEIGSGEKGNESKACPLREGPTGGASEHIFGVWSHQTLIKCWAHHKYAKDVCDWLGIAHLVTAASWQGAKSMVTALGTLLSTQTLASCVDWPDGWGSPIKRKGWVSPLPQGCLLNILSREGFLNEKNALELILPKNLPQLSPVKSQGLWPSPSWSTNSPVWRALTNWLRGHGASLPQPCPRADGNFRHPLQHSSFSQGLWEPKRGWEGNPKCGYVNYVFY